MSAKAKQRPEPLVLGRKGIVQQLGVLPVPLLAYRPLPEAFLATEFDAGLVGVPHNIGLNAMSDDRVFLPLNLLDVRRNLRCRQELPVVGRRSRVRF